jgi:hypothetical protein
MKRFTETDKWRDPWFRKLSPELKCLWSYITDHCDHAGIWEPDMETAAYFIGAPIPYERVSIAFADRIETLPGGKLRVIKFVKFQYGRLSRDCKPHSPVFACIEKHGYQVEPFENGTPLTEKEPKPIEGLGIGFESLQVKVKDKEEVKVKDKEEDRRRAFAPPTPEEVTAYAQEVGYPMDGAAWCDSYAAKGWLIGKAKMRDWRAAVRNWKAQGWQPKKAGTQRTLDPKYDQF